MILVLPEDYGGGSTEADERLLDVFMEDGLIQEPVGHLGGRWARGWVRGATDGVDGATLGE